ncbi:MAG TPA: S8 family serine peptidase [Actinomycetota bacterium]
MGTAASGTLGGGTVRRLGVAVLVAAVVVAGMLVPAGAAGGSGNGRLPVIVQATPGAAASAARLVEQLGGQVGRPLQVINGFTALVPAGQVGRLQRSPAVSSVARNEPVQMQAAAYAPTTDAGSLYTTTVATGAQAYWKAGYTGKGVDVAVVDTGTAPVGGLDGAGKVVNGPDLSFESQAKNLRYLDTYGHGTHMAGIIAGRGAGAVAGSYAGDTTNFLGMAPDARIVSVKVADAMGAADVSQIIAAIDWVVQNKNTGGLNIRVLNLSFGTNTTSPYTIDPLCHAVEAAWKKGITVVAATGNAGYYMTPDGPGLTSPARDPYVIAVGASDTMKTLSVADDRVASFSSSGVVATGGTKNPDLVAPGKSIISLAVPGSFIDQTYGATGAVTGGFMRGSGTSQATAVMSGAAALVLQQHPTWTNNQVKALLTTTAKPLTAGTLTPSAEGKGTLDLTKALSVTSVAAAYSYTNSTGTGTLDSARGTAHLVDNGVVLNGERDIFGTAVSTTTQASKRTAGTAWTGGTYNGQVWTGSSFSGANWTATTWSGRMWSGRMWSSEVWSGRMWSGRMWSAGTWTGRMWSGDGWSGNTWSSAGWS